MSKRLIEALKNYNNKESLQYQELFSKLVEGQRPDAIFIGCSDSRVMPNLFSHKDPGELFMVRNVGNLIPAANLIGEALGDESEASAIEYGLKHLHIDDIIVCGHSSCGAMKAHVGGREKVDTINLSRWLRHADAIDQIANKIEIDKSLNYVDQFSQLNVLLQIENLKTYPIVKEYLSQNKLRLHAWWFQIETAKMFILNETSKRFEIVT